MAPSNVFSWPGLERASTPTPGALHAGQAAKQLSLLIALSACSGLSDAPTQEASLHLRPHALDCQRFQTI